MGIARNSVSFALAISLAACGGGGGSSTSNSGGSLGGSTSPTPTPSTSACSLSARQDFTLAVFDEWYLFPDLLDKTVNQANHSTVQSYIDALVAPARAQNKDRYFSYITSIAEENAYYNSGSTAGFGVRLGYDTVNDRVFVLEAYEGAPALANGIDRGTEILAIGTSSSNLQSVSGLMASGGPQAVVNALGASTAGLSRILRVEDAGGVVREISLAKAEYELDPVSDRYGAKVLVDAGRQVGYINLRTFINTADNQLREAIGDFRSKGITEIVIDLRYNGGGLVSTAELFGDLLGRDKVGQVFSYTTLRPSKAAENESEQFQAEANAIAPTKIAFIGRSGTASASELVVNSMIPYLNSNMALVGTNTYGKPVGQFAFDRPECDDRLRVVTFKTENANRQGEYFNGLAEFVPNTCLAGDDISLQLGNAAEASIAASLDFLSGRTCTPISGTRTTAGSAQKRLLQPERPTVAQREVPGLF